MGRLRQERRAGRRWMVALLACLSVLVATGCDELIVGSWGANNVGQLGSGNFTSEPVPVTVDASGVLNGQMIVDIDAGSNASCALTASGTVACWGRMYRPGPEPNFTDVNTPMLIDTASLFPDAVVTQVAVGSFEACALSSKGQVGCWGINGTRILQGVLVLRGQVIQISLGHNHGCALIPSNLPFGYAVACWGLNNEGQIGDGTQIDRTQPVLVDTAVALAGQDIAEVSAADNFTCALATSGLLACWGANSVGQLGNGGTNRSTVPVAVSTTGVLAGKQIAALGTSIGAHMCVALADGGAACWGFGSNGELGNGVKADSTLPVAVNLAGAMTGRAITEVTMGIQHTCALLDDATGACWGSGLSGELGDGAVANSVVPVAVSALQGAGGVPRPMIALRAGGTHNLAIYENADPSQYVALRVPRRVVDTRGDIFIGGPVGPVGPSNPVTVDLSAVVPAGATAISFNLTATGQTASGYAELAPAGAAPGSSTLNWMGAQQTIANGYISKISADRKVAIRVGSAGTTHLVLDVSGYFVPSTDPAGALYTPMERRILDSRESFGLLPAHVGRIVDVYPGGMVPPVMPVAAMVNVTVTGTTNTGVLTVAGTEADTSSAINWSGPNQTIANAVITRLEPDGTFAITNNGFTGAAYVVVDLLGVFTVAADGGTGAQFYPVDPIRPVDSRSGPPLVGMLGFSPLVTTAPVPGDAVAQVINTTITGTSGTGYVYIGKPRALFPDTSMVNWYFSPTTRANGSIVPTNGNAVRTGVSFLSGTHYILDVGGYFR